MLSNIRKKTSGIVGVYPNPDTNFEEISNYLKIAALYGFGEVFTSIHLPELNFSVQLEYLRNLVLIAGLNSMSVCVDVGGETLDKIFSDPQLISMIRDLKIASVRLDCYYDWPQIRKVVEELKIFGFVLNASVLNHNEVIAIVNNLQHYDENINITACHNYYVRNETGLSESYFIKQNEIFSNLGVEITACIRSFHTMRGPLNEGLPTLEKHRTCSFEQSCLEMAYLYGVDRIMIGDPFSSNEELALLSSVMKNEPIELHINVNDLDDIEKKAMFGKVHYCRRDNGTFSLRLESSRKMAAYASYIKPRNCILRNKYSVTIDNEKYLRYSGEIQIITEDLPDDERVNVIGIIREEDRFKCKLVQNGVPFIFVC